MLTRSMFGCLFIILLGTACQHVVQHQEECCEVSDVSYVHPYGIEVEPDHWVQCGRNGQVISFMQDGSRITQNYANGMLDGESLYTYPESSQVRAIEVYSKDQLVSQTIYDSSGIPEYAFVNLDQKIKTLTTWYPSGGPRSVEKFDGDLLITADYYSPDNQRDSWVYEGNGERIGRDEEGNFLSLDIFHSGELVCRTFYYSNGHPSEVASYSGGQLHGERRSYYECGEPMAIEEWYEGQKCGTTTVFQNGERFSEVPYLCNKKNGIEKRYRDGKVLTQEITWYDDQMHGPTYTHTGENETMFCDWFYKGRLTTRANFESFGLPKARS